MAAPYMWEKLANAIVTALRADATLVTLTEHTASVHHIARANQPITARTPFLGVMHLTSLPHLDDSVTNMQRSTINLMCVDDSELTAMQIAGRMMELLESSGTPTNTAYFDVTDATIGVRNHATRYRRKEGPEKNEDTDKWEVTIVVDFIWVDVPCT